MRDLMFMLAPVVVIIYFDLFRGLPGPIFIVRRVGGASTSIGPAASTYLWLGLMGTR
jgi:hypothetical protein